MLRLPRIHVPIPDLEPPEVDSAVGSEMVGVQVVFDMTIERVNATREFRMKEAIGRKLKEELQSRLEGEGLRVNDSRWALLGGPGSRNIT